jgi:HAD superfamily hydrolase (TIGR01450 family)
VTEALPHIASGAWALERYEQVRDRLPGASFPANPAPAEGLLALMDQFDAFVFDSFGVLNVGDQSIPGANACIDALRKAGKATAILTNAATVPLAGLEAKYAKLGFSFGISEIISSRQVLCEGFSRFGEDMVWGVAAPPEAQIEELPVRCRPLCLQSASFDDCDGFVLLSSQDWTPELQVTLSAELIQRPRPLLVGNPDIVAPREDGLSLEPGAFAHAIADETGMAPAFYGKPFANAFDMVRRRFDPDIRPHRIAMVGDSLHTDILGGAAAGWRTILVTDNGLMKDIDIPAAIGTTGIVPDIIVPSIEPIHAEKSAHLVGHGNSASGQKPS